MTQRTPYRIEVAACPANPGYYRWAVFQGGERLDLSGYAYASAWSAEEAARVALHWHLVLTPLRARSGPAVPALGPAPAEAARDAARSRAFAERSVALPSPG